MKKKAPLLIATIIDLSTIPKNLLGAILFIKKGKKLPSLTLFSALVMGLSLFPNCFDIYKCQNPISQYDWCKIVLYMQLSNNFRCQYSVVEVCG
jgi:hypothetical protein